MKKVYEKYQGITFTKKALEEAKKRIDEGERKNTQEANGENGKADMNYNERNNGIKVNVNINQMEMD